MKMIVTGNSSGLGKSIYDYYRSSPFLDVIGISKRGPLCFDLSYSCVEDIKELIGPVEIAILNAGIMPLDESGRRADIRNLNFEFNEEFLRKAPDLIRPGGSVILMASVSGVMGDVEVPYYSAMKAALINLTRSYAKKYSKITIRVNSISPGFFRTNLVPGETPQCLISKIPLGREANPEELLPVVDALIKCEYITGQNIIVDGGLSL